MHELRNRNWKVITWCGILFFGIIIVVFFGIEKITNDTCRIFLSTLFSTVATVLLANVLWEIIAKESFAKSLLKLVSISDNIANSGIETVYVDFLSIDWEKELQQTQTFWVAVTYAATWRESNRTILGNFIKKNGNCMNIILPDPEIKACMKEYDRRFNFPSGKTKERVEEAIQAFDNLGATVYLYPGTMQASYYRLDKVGIMSFFNHRQEKGIVPAIKAEEHGKFYTFIDEELNSMYKQSVKVTKVTAVSEAGKHRILIGRESHE